ncbi:alpha/beta fold hydrolase [Streptomyces sp. NRRL S-244]|uniref:alpha/beta fold hydrolase n=1 Tax=Streptomyces sp. NRRL S-244 TaxID=1463897 RepID=UPI000A6E7BD1|nr:alpha/beta fold hydrolase [Streptomyces sp. NRRL S-244]
MNSMTTMNPVNPLLAHDVAGPADGPALVLLHSSVCDRRMWEPQWRPLAEAGFRVVRADFRTCGDSPAAIAPYRDGDDVLDLLDSLGIERAAFAGSSYGGRVALGIASRHPERVAALALLCPAVPAQQRGPALQKVSDAEDALLEAGDLAGAVELMVDTWLGPSATEEARALVRTMQRHIFEVAQAVESHHELPEHEADLGAITAPTLVMGGAHDVEDFRTIAATLPHHIPGARHIELPWAGHLPSLERPEETLALLLDFLR